MKKIIFLFLASVIFSSCSNFEMKDLYGSWTSENFDFTFNEDKTINYRMGQIADKGTYRPLGNAIEVVSSQNLVVTRITVKSLENDTLTIDLPLNGASRVFKLTRKK
jgi:hypothetical protein